MPALFSPNSGIAALTTAPLLEVSYPGSMAPHFRVQALTSEGQPQWKLVASFGDQQLAQICLDRLRRQGEVARLIAYRRVPTAA
ncbi:hypothetical protein [Anatilimnocola floriformis]|uniref:hypothetical protein n=1 Tax=Anatilimnocola floriformis TaxID=2948575 RepID=UPI0020C4C4F4|nr:hypothetical protein [Anatilimnocola floriformis]